MTTLLIYESMFGNTKTVAEAIARGLEEGGRVVTAVEVGDAPKILDSAIDLVVAGGPTHAFGLPRESTRADAARQAEGQTIVSSRLGLREWIDDLDDGRSLRFATFDTKVRRPRLPGSAAHGAAKRLRHIGWIEVAAPTTFYVGGTRGPLLAGEIERAEAWGRQLASVAARVLVE